MKRSFSKCQLIINQFIAKEMELYLLPKSNNVFKQVFAKINFQFYFFFVKLIKVLELICICLTFLA